MSAHAVRPDSQTFQLLEACTDSPLTIAQLLACTHGINQRGAMKLYHLEKLGWVSRGPDVQYWPGRRVSTWVRTAAGTEALTLAATHLLPVQAWLLIHLGPEWRSCGSLPCPANLTRVSTLASWRGVRAYNLQQLADQGLIQRQYGKAHLTELGLAALPDARVRLGLPEQDKAAR